MVCLINCITNKFLHFLFLSTCTCINSALAEVGFFLFLKHIYLEDTLLKFYTFYFYPRVSGQHVQRYVLVFETHLQRRHPNFYAMPIPYITRSLEHHRCFCNSFFPPGFVSRCLDVLIYTTEIVLFLVVLENSVLPWDETAHTRH